MILKPILIAEIQCPKSKTIPNLASIPAEEAATKVSQAILETQDLCPWHRQIGFLVSTLSTVIESSSPPAAKNRPLGDQEQHRKPPKKEETAQPSVSGKGGKGKDKKLLQLEKVRVQRTMLWP